MTTQDILGFTFLILALLSTGASVFDYLRDKL